MAVSTAPAASGASVTTTRTDVEVNKGIAEVADRQNGTGHSAGCYSDEEEHETDASSNRDW